MICSEVRPLLDLLCDGVLPAKESALVLDHLRSCDQCQPEWAELEQLRARFLEAKQKVEIPAGLMSKISESIRNEERENRERFFRKYIPPGLAAVAAAFAVAGFVVIPWLNHTFKPVVTSSTTMPPAPKSGAPISGATPLAGSLVDNFAANCPVELVSDPKQLEPTIGYPLKYLHLPAWRLYRAGVYRSPSVAVAKLDFVKGHCGAGQQVTCYQAPAGAINASAPPSKDVHVKRVTFGNRGNLQFAFWTQDERDYLFITRSPKSVLEEIVSGT